MHARSSASNVFSPGALEILLVDVAVDVTVDDEDDADDDDPAEKLIMLSLRRGLIWHKWLLGFGKRHNLQKKRRIRDSRSI